LSSHTTVIVNWYGPYTYEEIEEKRDWKNGLYLATGKLKYKQRSATIQYCGITEGSFYNTGQTLNVNFHSLTTNFKIQ
jgi:hypothetical protein